MRIHTNQNRAKQTTNKNRTLKIVSTAYVTDIFAPTRHIDHHVSHVRNFCEIHAHDLRDKKCAIYHGLHRDCGKQLFMNGMYDRYESQSISAKCSTDLHKSPSTMSITKPPHMRATTTSPTARTATSEVRATRTFASL